VPPASRSAIARPTVLGGVLVCSRPFMSPRKGSGFFASVRAPPYHRHFREAWKDSFLAGAPNTKSRLPVRMLNFLRQDTKRLSAEGRINFLRDLLARLMERRIRHSLLDRVDLATSLEMDRREWESGRAGLERDLERCGDVHLHRAFEALAVQFADAVAKLKDENLVAARAGQATGPDRSAGEFSQQELRNWYGYLANKKALGESPSRDDDWEAAKRALGEGIPREKVWALRTELAPDAWKRAGRRKSSPGRPDKA
jgi:hypothetical protein